MKLFLLVLVPAAVLLFSFAAEAKNCRGVGRCGDDGSNCTVSYPDFCDQSNNPQLCRDGNAYCIANDTGDSEGAAQDVNHGPDGDDALNFLIPQAEAAALSEKESKKPQNPDSHRIAIKSLKLEHEGFSRDATSPKD